LRHWNGLCSRDRVCRAFELGSRYMARAIEMRRGIKRKMRWKNLVTVSQKNRKRMKQNAHLNEYAAIK